MARAKTTFICSRCKGDNVRRDGYAAWDRDSQTWVLGEMFSAEFCLDCDGSTMLEEVEDPGQSESTIWAPGGIAAIDGHGNTIPKGTGDDRKW